jgi:hypothetical protein
MRRFFYNVANPFIAIFLVIFVGIGFAFSLMTSLSIEAWSLILAASFVICAAIFIFVKPDFAADLGTSITWTWRDRLLSYLPFLIFTPGFLAVFSNSHFQMIFEGDIHTSYIVQILNSITPPENPFLPGYPPNYFWLYHALLATVTNLTNLAPPLVSSFLNVLALISIIGWVKQTLRAMGMGKRHPLLLNLFTVFVIFGLNVFGIIHAVDNILASGIGTNISDDMMLAGDYRLRSLWFKFLAFNSFPLTIVYYMLGIFAAVQLVKGHVRATTIILLLVAIVGGTAFNLGTGMFTFAIIVPAIVVAFTAWGMITTKPLTMQGLVSRAKTAYEMVRANISRIELVSLAILIVFMGLFITGYYVGATESYVTGRFSLTYGDNLIDLFSVFYPLIPVFILGIVMGLKTPNRAILLTGAGAILGCAVAYLSVLVDDNQYKFVHLSSPLVCLTVVPVFDRWINGVKGTRWQQPLRIIAGFMLFLVLINVTYTGIIRLKNAYDLYRNRVKTDEIVYEGPTLVSRVEPYQDVYTWLSESTTAQTVVVMPVEETARLAMLSGRLPYAGIERFNFVKGMPEYAERVNQVRSFFAPETRLVERQQLIEEFLEWDTPRPKMILIPHQKIPPDQLAALNLQLLFQGQNADVYALST